MFYRIHDWSPLVWGFTLWEPFWSLIQSLHWLELYSDCCFFLSHFVVCVFLAVCTFYPCNLICRHTTLHRFSLLFVLFLHSINVPFLMFDFSHLSLLSFSWPVRLQFCQFCLLFQITKFWLFFSLFFTSLIYTLML